MNQFFEVVYQWHFLLKINMLEKNDATLIWFDDATFRR